MKLKSVAIAVLLMLGAVACQNEEIQSPSKLDDFNYQRLNKADVSLNSTSNARQAGGLENFLITVNEALAAQNLQLAVVEYMGAEKAGNTVYFNDRGNKQLGADFVPGDPRRGGFADIAFARDGLEGGTSSGLSQEETDQAILSAMSTWDNVSCSKGLVLTSLGASPFDLGYVQALVTGGVEGSFFFTDLMHSGFNTSVTDAVFGPGSNVLGVTFTFIWLDDEDNPSDIDNNGKTDVAFRDIYYNDSYNWAIGSTYDVETVALHEAGHGLSQAHFGKAFSNRGGLHFAPRAVMNAAYSGVQTQILKTDNAGHCSNWAQWPNK